MARPIRIIERLGPPYKTPQVATASGDRDTLGDKMQSLSSNVAELTWDQVQARLDDGAAALLPIGAGAKTHGFHLPMNTDQIQAEWLASRIAADLDCLIWPTLTYGHYPVFVQYAGSCSLEPDTFRSVVAEIVAGILRFGPAAVLVLDTGISTLPPVSAAIEELGDAQTGPPSPYS